MTPVIIFYHGSGHYDSGHYDSGHYDSGHYLIMTPVTSEYKRGLKKDFGFGAITVLEFGSCRESSISVPRRLPSQPNPVLLARIFWYDGQLHLSPNFI
ncbi:hypothetical protein SLEP1_g27654 [Rubroshorea leprosula]|uniref:Uncharacterized protein n=1 Tax=Rubroshorea leprosula TaxID=152421 RepID=A0AAV5K3R2_9ROSI|nr:hypothetical protein SLEP1_g27654 [Rubroshorea leprosula]